MNYITTISGLIVLNDRSSFRFDEFIVEAQEGVVYVGGDGGLSWSLLPSNTFVLGVKYDTTEDLMTAIAELSSSGDAPSAGGVDSVTGNLVTGTATNPKINLFGTSRDILTFDGDGKPVCKPAGWRQFSDLPMPPTFSNGVLTGTAFQPDGTALFGFLELALGEGGTNIVKPNAIPFYNPGQIGTGGGTLGVADARSETDAVNLGQLNAKMGNMGMWEGTQAQYDALPTKSLKILYFIS